MNPLVIKSGDLVKQTPDKGVQHVDMRVPTSMAQVTHYEVTAADGTRIEMPIESLRREHELAIARKSLTTADESLIVYGQVAKTPFEVLANMNTPLLNLILHKNVAECMLTLFYGAHCVAEYFGIDDERVRISDFWVAKRGIYIQYYDNGSQNRGSGIQRIKEDYIEAVNGKHARMCMEDDFFDSIKRHIWCMMDVAANCRIDSEDKTDITDIEEIALSWPTDSLLFQELHAERIE